MNSKAGKEWPKNDHRNKRCYASSSLNSKDIVFNLFEILIADLLSIFTNLVNCKSLSLLSSINVILGDRFSGCDEVKRDKYRLEKQSNHDSHVSSWKSCSRFRCVFHEVEGKHQERDHISQHWDRHANSQEPLQAECPTHETKPVDVNWYETESKDVDDPLCFDAEKHFLFCLNRHCARWRRTLWIWLEYLRGLRLSQFNHWCHDGIWCLWHDR